MFLWRDLDTKIALKRLRILVIPFGVLFLIPIVYFAYQNFLGFSFRFFTGYGVFEYTFLGIKYFGEPVFPVVTGATVFVAVLFVSSLVPIFVIAPFTNFIIRPFVDVRGFENYGKVCEGITSL